MTASRTLRIGRRVIRGAGRGRVPGLPDRGQDRRVAAGPGRDRVLLLIRISRRCTRGRIQGRGRRTRAQGRGQLRRALRRRLILTGPRCTRGRIRVRGRDLIPVRGRARPALLRPTLGRRLILTGQRCISRPRPIPMTMGRRFRRRQIPIRTGRTWDGASRRSSSSSMCRLRSRLQRRRELPKT